jgi:serine/threonine protein kinase
MANKDSDDDGQYSSDEQRDSDELDLGRIDPLAGEYSEFDDARLVALALGEPPPPPPRIKERRYVLLERIGSGGMGDVHAAYDVDMDRKVAIKFLQLQPRQDARKAEQRLEREAKAMAKIATHPNVVHVYDRGIEGSRFYVVMEYIPGSTLLEWQQPARSPDEIVSAYLQAGRGLAAIHEAGLVHRDFKPANIFVTSGKAGSMRVVVGDLGLALATEPDTGRPEGVDVEGAVHAAMPLTATGTHLGTIQYMAPEQLRGEKDVDARCDQFAFCVSLYEALCGRRPFGKGASEPRALLEVMEQGMPRGARLRNGKALPGRVESVLRRGLSMKREDRFPDMPALLDALAPRTRRVWPWVMGSITASALALALLSLRGNEPDPCQVAASDGLRGFWNTDVTNRLKERRNAGGALMLARAWDTLGRNLERQAGEWYADSVALCREEPDELPAPGKVCLDENQETLQQLSDAWLGPEEPRATPRQAEMLYDDAEMLFRLRDCHAKSPGVLPAKSELAAAETPDAGAKPESLGARLTRIERLVRSADYEEARALALAALEEVKQRDQDPMAAELMYRLGHALTYLEEHEEADRLLGEAANLAASHDMKALLVDVWIYRLKHVLVDLEDADRAGGLVTAVELALRQTGMFGSNTLWEAEYEEARGLLASREGKLDEAAAHHLKALAIREQVVVPGDPDLAAILRSKSLNNLANVEQSQGKRKEAVQHYEDALSVREEMLGPDHPLVGLVLFNLGRIAADRGDYDRAIGHLTRALDIENTIDAGTSSIAPVATILSRRVALGFTEIRAHGAASAAGQLETASKHLERATAHATEIVALHRRLAQEKPAAMQDKARIDEHVFVAGIHWLRQELPDALAQLDAALRIRKQAWDATICRDSLEPYLDDLISAASLLCETRRAEDARVKLAQVHALVSTCQSDPSDIERRIQEEVTDPACRP